MACPTLVGEIDNGQIGTFLADEYYAFVASTVFRWDPADPHTETVWNTSFHGTVQAMAILGGDIYWSTSATAAAAQVRVGQTGTLVYEFTAASFGVSVIQALGLVAADGYLWTVISLNAGTSGPQSLWRIDPGAGTATEVASNLIWFAPPSSTPDGAVWWGSFGGEELNRRSAGGTVASIAYDQALWGGAIIIPQADSSVWVQNEFGFWNRISSSMVLTALDCPEMEAFGEFGLSGVGWSEDYATVLFSTSDDEIWRILGAAPPSMRWYVGKVGWRP